MSKGFNNNDTLVDENIIAEQLERDIHKFYEKQLEDLSNDLDKLSKENENYTNTHELILKNLKEKEEKIHILCSRLYELQSQSSEFQRQLDSMILLKEGWIKENELLKESLSFQFVYEDESEKYPTLVNVEELNNNKKELVNQPEKQQQEQENTPSKEEEEDIDDELAKSIEDMDVEIEFHSIIHGYTKESDKPLVEFAKKLKDIYDKQNDELYCKNQELESIQESVKLYKKKIPESIQHYRNCITKEKKGRKYAEMLSATYKKRITALESILKGSSSESDSDYESNSDEED